MSQSNEHTVVLIQFDKNDTASRTYLDFDSLTDALDGLMQVFE